MFLVIGDEAFRASDIKHIRIEAGRIEFFTSDDSVHHAVRLKEYFDPMALLPTPSIREHYEIKTDQQALRYALSKFLEEVQYRSKEENNTSVYVGDTDQP